MGISVMGSLTSIVDTFITFIDGVVHRASYYAPYVRYNIYIYIYTYDTIYVLSCVECTGGTYVNHGNMTYTAALCMTYMVYICDIFPAQCMSCTSSSTL